MSSNRLSSSTQRFYHVSLNQDHDLFAVGTNTGFVIYSTDPFAERFKREIPGGINIVELLFRSNILALVGTGMVNEFSSQRLHIWDDNQNKTIAEFDFESPILSVKLRRDKILIVLETRIYVYNLVNLTLINRILTTVNSYGLGLISPQPELCLVAYLSSTPGEILLTRLPSKETENLELANKFQTPLIIAAHSTNVRYICFSSKARYLASASVSGTTISIFDTTNGRQVARLIRGKASTDIHSMNFSADLKYFATTGSSGTLHVFHLQLPSETESAASTPPRMYETRSFVKIPLPSKVKSFASFSPISSTNVLVSTDSGRYIKYLIDEDGKHKQKYELVMESMFTD